jgi:hypothetical protein
MVGGRWGGRTAMPWPPASFGMAEKTGSNRSLHILRGRFLRRKGCWQRGGAAGLLSRDRGSPERRREATAGARVSGTMRERES